VRNGFTELLIHGGERAQLGLQRGEKTPLQVVEDRRQVSHAALTLG